MPAKFTEEMARLGAAMLLEWLAQPSPPELSRSDGVTYAAKIAKAEARIDWARPADQIERQVRAFAPAPGAWFEANGERIKLLDCGRDRGRSASPAKCSTSP